MLWILKKKQTKHRVLVYGKFKEGASFYSVLEYSKCWKNNCFIKY